MKKYLFGLGAMLVGAGLMFVLMHGEVSADSKPDPFDCSRADQGKDFIGDPLGAWHCETKTLDCGVLLGRSISCVKKGMF